MMLTRATEEHVRQNQNLAAWEHDFLMEQVKKIEGAIRGLVNDRIMPSKHQLRLLSALESIGQEIGPKRVIRLTLTDMREEQNVRSSLLGRDE